MKICFVNTYLEGREAACEKGLYPRSHLWGIDTLRRAGHEVVVAPGCGHDVLSKVASRLTRLTRGRFGDLDQELQVWRTARGCDLVYVASANLFWTVWRRRLGLFRPKLATWVYTPPAHDRCLSWLLNNRTFLRGYDAFVCLTDAAAKAHARLAPRAHVRRVDWAADTELFKPNGKDRTEDFFFACGRTNRDYATLCAAAAQVDVPVKVLVSPSGLRGLNVPVNVSVIAVPTHAGSDRGISYPELIGNYYLRARAVIIPRKPHPHDTNGFTNLLEALAVGKPVIMTRTGALDFDVEKEGVGLHVEPGDVEGMASAMRKLAGDPKLAGEMGRRARQLAERHYNLERFGRDLCAFLESVVPAVKPEIAR